MENAILMAITDNYAFCAANVIISIHDNSPAVFGGCDFIIYQHDLSARNRRVLSEIGEGHVIFRDISPLASPWLEAECCLHISLGEKYNLEGLHVFELLDSYRRVLWLESDTCIRKPLDELFDMECDIAGLFGKPAVPGVPGPFTHLLRDPGDAPWQFVQGAVIMFCDSLRRCAITPAQLRERADEFGTRHPNGGTAGIHELFIPYLAYHYGMHASVLPYEYNAYLGDLSLGDFNNAAIQHFASGFNKPWLSGHLYHLYPQFGRNLLKFRKMGGGTPLISTFRLPRSSMSATPSRSCITSISSAAASESGPSCMTVTWSLTSLPAPAI